MNLVFAFPQDLFPFQLSIALFSLCISLANTLVFSFPYWEGFLVVLDFPFD